MSRNSLIPTAELRRLSQRLVDLQSRVDLVEQSLRATQLSHSSIEGGAVTIRDSGGTARGYVGMQPDGTTGLRAVNGPPPPRPNTPEIVPIMAGLGVTWNGEFISERPGDFSHLNVYVSGAGENFIHGPTNLVGTLSNAGSIPVTPIEGTHWARFVAVNTSGEESEPSLTASGTPAAVVAQELLDGIVTEVKLAANAVTAAKLAANAVTETKIAPDAVTTPKLVAGAVQAEKIAAAAVLAEKIAASAVTAEKIAALAITADKIAANAIQAGHIQAGSITAEKLAALLIVAGTPGGNRVQISQANGIEQWVNGQRTLWIPPSGTSEFTGGVTTGSAAQFIRIDPGSTVGYPRILVQDDSSTRRIAMYYQGDSLWLRRETIATGVGSIRGGQLHMAPAATYLTHHLDGNGTVSSSLDLIPAGAYLYGRNSSGGIVSRVSVQSDGNVYLDGDGTILAGTTISGAVANLSPVITANNGDPIFFWWTGGNLWITNADTGVGIKQFVIPHPLEPDDRWLVHGCTESPSAGVEYWGEATIEDGEARVELPGYFESLTKPDHRHALVTPIAPDDPNEWAPPQQAPQKGAKAGRVRPVARIPRVGATRIRDGKFTVYSDGPDGSKVSWLVKAERAGADFAVEPLKADVHVSGTGPYLTVGPRKEN